MERKLNLDFDLVECAREIAKNIASDVQKFINKHTTDTIERTICRLLGIDGVDKFEVPIPNVVITNIKKGNKLHLGAAILIGNAMLKTKKNPQEIAEMIVLRLCATWEYPHYFT